MLICIFSFLMFQVSNAGLLLVKINAGGVCQAHIIQKVREL